MAWTKHVKGKLGRVLEQAEERGWLSRVDGFRRDYAGEYPELAVLEREHATIRRECEALLPRKEAMVDMERLGGAYTRSKVHTVRWKTFMFKSGRFVEDNCRLAPSTAEMLRSVPGLYTAFFSVLDPHQHIPPHWGYWKGFLRYHLGVIVPNDNANGECWIRVNSDPDDNRGRDPSAIERGRRYYWREGEGVLFDDTFLHEARNESDQVRVVLFLDVARKMPLPLQAYNRFVLEAAHLAPPVARIRRIARLGTAPTQVARR
ncbi:MAG: aspartyl/asparaginyl beta-hydroxylase domain-containing protein [Myxococcota bacterium]